MYKYSGKGLFTKSKLGDLKKKMDEAKNRTPEQKAQIKKESDEKRQQKKELLDENLQLASLLAKKAGRTITKGSTMVDNLYKKVGIDVGMDKKREDAGKVMSNLGKIGTKILSGRGFADALNKIKKQQAMSPAEKEEKARQQAENKQKFKENIITTAKVFDKGTKMAVGYAQKKFNNAIDKYGLERIGIKKDTKDYGGFLPKEKQFFKVAKEEYKLDPPTQIDEFTLVYKSPTIHVYLNEAGRTILLSLRGTVPTDKDDLLADASIAINRLYYSNRFKRDKAELQKIFQKYPPSQYEYYLTGHSLGGAITNSVVREYPKNIKYAVTYNPAFQPYDLYSQQRDKIKRLYTPDDALYKIGGRFMSPTVVPTTKSLLPNLNLVTTGINAYQGHSMDNFNSYYGMGMPMPKKRGRPRKMVGGSSCGCMMCGK